MRWVGCVFLVLSLVVCGAASGPGEDWLPVTPQDLQIKEVPNDPGARAVQLYFADQINQSDRSEFYYHRIKVLNDAGREYANVEIILPPLRKVKIRDLQARTILPDGRIMPFTGEPFEKTIVKGHGVKVQARTFIFPEVTVGSILEYKYTLQSKEYPDPEWLIQQDLFTVKEHFLFSYPSAWGITYDLSAGLNATPVHNKNSYELEMQNVPGFEREEQMPPEYNYKLRVRFFPGSTGMLINMSMLQVAEPMFAAIQKFTEPHREIRDAAAETIGNETDPEKQLRLLYARAQQIRNLTFERTRTESEEKKEQLQQARNAVDVLKHGYGDRDDVTLLFVAMARAAGLDASVLLVVGRRQRLMDDKLPAILQTDSEIATVLLNGKQVFLDPGTRFCPYGLLRWMRTATTGVLLVPGGMRSFPTPSPVSGDFMISRTADVALADDGSVSGTLIVEYRRGEALERRLDALNTDEAGRIRQLEDEMKAWLPVDAIAKLVKVDGWDSSDAPLVAQFDLRVPAFASVTGKRLLTPLFLFQSKPMYAFTAATRRYPVYFPYTFSEIDTFVLTIPPGLVVESVPPALEVQPIFAHYSSTSQMNGKELIATRSLAVNRMNFPPKDYPELKNFFAKVKEGDGLQAVLHPATQAEPVQPKDKLLRAASLN